MRGRLQRSATPPPPSPETRVLTLTPLFPLHFPHPLSNVTMGTQGALPDCIPFYGHGCVASLYTLVLP